MNLSSNYVYVLKQETKTSALTNEAEYKTVGIFSSPKKAEKGIEEIKVSHKAKMID